MNKLFVIVPLVLSVTSYASVMAYFFWKKRTSRLGRLTDRQAVVAYWITLFLGALIVAGALWLKEFWNK